MLKQKFVATVVACSIFTSSLTSLAEDPSVKLPPVPSPVPGEVDPGEAISPLKQNQRAPFTGLLLSPIAITKLMVDMQHVDEKVKIEVDRATARQKAEDELKLAQVKAELAYVQNTTKIQLENRDRQIDNLTKSLQKAESSQVNPLLLVGGGILAGAAMILVTAYVAKQ